MQVIRQDELTDRAASGVAGRYVPPVELLPAARRRRLAPTSPRTPRNGVDRVLPQILEGALELTGADFGSVQLYDAASGALELVAQAGLGTAFAEHFAVVDEADPACGRAARTSVQSVIIDVEADRDFRPHRRIAAACGFRAVLATPLTDQSGALVGLVSVYFRRPGRPPEHDLRALRIYGQLAGHALALALHGDAAVLARAAETAVRRIFAASLILAGAQASSPSPVRAARLAAAVNELDQTIREIQAAAINALRA